MKHFAFAAVAAACSVATAANAQQSDLAAEFLQGHAYAARQVTDRFADRPVIAHDKPFKVELTTRDGDTLGMGASSAFWTYRNGALRVSLSMYDAPRGYPSRTEGFNIGGKMTSGKPYRGSNAFGASTMVAVERWRHDALVVVDRPRGEPSKIEGLSGDAKLDDFSVRLPISGDAARRLTPSLRVVVEGATAPLPDGAVMDCATRSLEPRIDAPIDTTDVRCWIGAKIDRIAIVDATSGTILKEWARP